MGRIQTREDLPAIMGLNMAEGVVHRNQRETRGGYRQLYDAYVSRGDVIGKSRAANYRNLKRYYLSNEDLVLQTHFTGDQTGKKKDAEATIYLLVATGDYYDLLQVNLESKYKNPEYMDDVLVMCRFSKHAAARYLQTVNHHLLNTDKSFRGFVQETMQGPAGFKEVLKAGNFLADLANIFNVDVYDPVLVEGTSTAYKKGQGFDSFIPFIYQSDIGEFRFKGYPFNGSNGLYHLEMVTFISYDAMSSSSQREKISSDTRMRLWSSFKGLAH